MTAGQLPPVMVCGVAVCDYGRAQRRRALAKDILPDDARQKLRGVWNLERYGTCVWMAVHFAISVGAIYRRRFKWGQ